MDWDGQRPSAPSTPTSMSSHSTSGTNSSKEKIPPYKQLNPSPALSALSKFSDDELFRKGGDELLRILRRVESDYKGLLSEHSNVVKDVNRRFQIFVLEARGLKEINQKLQDDNQELRDLCCFLDDDRQRSRKLAREWQRFGRYTASVMHSEVAAYQEKLQQLEERQAELLSDNMELKELCLFLDHERSQQMSGDRDDGDGSSNGTVPGPEEMGQSHGDSDGQVTPTPTPIPSQQDASAAYVRQLEQRIQRLEEEKKQLAQRVERNGADGYHPSDQEGSSRNVRVSTDLSQPGHASDSHHGHTTPGRDRTTPTFSMNKPEAVVHAMKVLQVHEQLERPRDPVGTENLGETEKAIVREMCNVVWRKLGDVGEYPPHTTANATYPAPHSAPASGQPYRPQSAAGNPHIPSGHPGPPRSQPPSLSLPSSPTATSAYRDPREPRPANTAPGSPGDTSGPSSLGKVSQAGGYPGERRSQLPQARPGAVHAGQGHSAAHSPGGREHFGQEGGGLESYGQGREGRENLPGQGGTSRENVPGRKGNKAVHGPAYSHPVSAPSAHTTERPRQLQPPPYSSAKTSPTFAPTSRPGPNPPQYNPATSQQIPQPHHQPPSSRHQQNPPKYQQRTHPLHANQGPSQSSHGHPMPRAASSSATYYVGHPTSQSKSHSAPALTSHPHPVTSSSIPGASYMYSQRGGGGVGAGGPPQQFRSHDQSSRPGADSGRTEWRQTYLDD